MSKRIRKSTAIVLSIILLTTGCSSINTNTQEENTDKTVVSMMYPIQLDHFESLVESTYKDIDLQIEMTTTATMNGDSERRLKKNHGTDIITTTLPTGEIKQYTMDLSAEEFADDYQDTVLKSVLIDGEMHYVPLPGQYSGYVINETLAKQLKDTLPKSNDELLELLDLAVQNKVGMNEDGTVFGLVCADTGGIGTFFLGLQIPDFLGTMDGIEWTSDLEENKATFLGTWDNSLDWFQSLVSKGYFNPKSYSMYVTNAMPVEQRMLDGTMMACYGNMNLLSRLNQSSDEYEYTMLPFLSNEGNSSWITSAPDGYLAINKSLDTKENASTKDACIRILELLSTQEGQKAWLEDTSATTSYLSEYENPKESLPTDLQTCVDEGCVYSIQISSDMLSFFGKEMVAVLNEEQTMKEALIALDDYQQNGSEEVDYDQSIVGSVEEDMPYENNNTRLEETAIGNLVADATAEAAGTELAVVNGGGIRAGLYTGDVYGYELSDVCPYGNHIIVLEVTGEVITQMLENGISQTIREGLVPAGRFLQVSGLCYSYQPMTQSTPAKLLDVTLADGTPLQKDEKYQIAVTDYMAGSSGYLENNGDGFTMLNVYSNDVEKNADVKLIKETEITYSEALKQYFENRKDSTILKKCEGRISIVTGG